jgi:hypothetical protein
VDGSLNIDRLMNRWLATLGIGTLLFGFALFVLRIPMRTIMIFFALGIPVILLWLYVDQKSRRQKKEIDDFNTLQDQTCICPVCEHDKAAVCLDQKCPCCIMMKGTKILGHSVNPLQ